MNITSKDIQQVESVAHRHRLKMALLFGSAASGKGEHPASDLDIAVLYEGKVADFRESAELRHDLQEIFPGRDVDLCLIDHADPLLLKKITENCLLLYGACRDLQELKIYAYKRYHDHRRYFDIERAFVDRFLKISASSE